MEKKTSIRHTVEASNGMKSLLLNPKVTTDIAKAADSFELIFLQAQRDLAARKDDEVTLQTLKGLGPLMDLVLLFKREGEADIAAEQKPV
jgi:hypothetical protein